MRFVISRTGGVATPADYGWALERKDGKRVCVNARALVSEQEARSDIAEAKTTMKGARFAKVEVEK